MPPTVKFSVETPALSKEFNWDKAADMADRMLEIARVMMPIKQEDERRERKLKESPKGFHLEGSYSCAICSDYCSDEATWYDQYGIKCMECQQAIDRGEIPPSCAKDKESWYSAYDMEEAFNAKSATVRRWIREGVLKSRPIKRGLLLLIEDNKDTLPRKELVKDPWIHEETDDGRVMSHCKSWHSFVDPFKHLKGYKIMDHLEMRDGQLAPKKK